MRVLIGCEFSGVVRRALRAVGHDAWSCDWLEAEDGSPHHIVSDVRRVLGDGWNRSRTLAGIAAAMAEQWFRNPSSAAPMRAGTEGE